MLKQTFVDTKMIDMHYVSLVKDLFNIHKGIIHGQITKIKGSDIDAWQSQAEKYLSEMSTLIGRMIESR